MNPNRRKRLLGLLKEVGEIRSQIETIRDEEDEARDNMPENLQETERFVNSEESSEALSTAEDYLNEAASAIEEAI